MRHVRESSDRLHELIEELGDLYRQAHSDRVAAKDLSRIVASAFHALQRSGLIETLTTTNQFVNFMESVFLAYRAEPDGSKWVEEINDCIRLMGGDFGDQERRGEVRDAIVAAFENYRREEGYVIKDGAQPDSSSDDAPESLSDCETPAH